MTEPFKTFIYQLYSSYNICICEEGMDGKAYLPTIRIKCEFCFRARPRDCIKLQTVAEGSNRMTRLQLWTSKPSSRIEVATIMLTCSILHGNETFNLQKSSTKVGKNKTGLTTPLRNSSTILFWTFLLCDCSIELCPAVYSVFQPLNSGSNSFNKDRRTIAVMILSTNMMHLKSFRSLLDWKQKSTTKKDC